MCSNRASGSLITNMSHSYRLEAIQEGKFLSLQSDASVTSSSVDDDARDRPFVVPHYDPEDSIYTSRYSKNLAIANPPSESNYSRSQADYSFGRQEHGLRSTESIKPPFKPTPTPRCKFEKPGLPSSPASPPPYTFRPPRPPRPGAHLGRRSAMKISRLSITPSIVIAGCLPPHLDQSHGSYPIISTAPGKISPMHIVRLPAKSNDDQEPPDGGTLAWLQTLAGFFVIMDAQ